MLYKTKLKENNSNRNMVELRFVCTGLWVIAKNMHTNFEVIWTYGDKV